MRWGADHQREALLGGRQLRDVMLWVGAADVLLHGAVPLLLCSTACYSEVWGAVQCSGGARHDVGAAAAVAAPSSHSSHGDSTRGRLTPVQRLRQAELSWLRSGQTTTLFSSETEKDPVSEARGGMASIYPPCLCECAGRAQGAGLQDCSAGRGSGRGLGRQWHLQSSAAPG